MVSPDELEALDLLCWLRNGDDAARLVYCNQSTISRRSQQAIKVFDLFFSHGQGPHPQAGSATLLRMEREVHQLFRLSGGNRLRLHAPYWASRRLDGQLDAHWMVNPTRNKEPVGEALRLLEDRVIDAMIAETRQRPADDDPKFVCFDLYETPLLLCAEVLAEKRASNPLYADKRLSSGDVGSLSYVRPQRFLSRESKGCVFQLYNLLYGDTRDADCGSSQPLKDGYSVTFVMSYHPLVFAGFGHYRPIDSIDYGCGFMAKESLVVLRGLEESPSILALLEFLSSSYLKPLKQHAEVQIDRAFA